MVTGWTYSFLTLLVLMDQHQKSEDPERIRQSSSMKESDGTMMRRWAYPPSSNFFLRMTPAAGETLLSSAARGDSFEQ
jgi:hypothetical protein